MAMACSGPLWPDVYWVFSMLAVFEVEVYINRHVERYNLRLKCRVTCWLNYHLRHEASENRQAKYEHAYENSGLVIRLVTRDVRLRWEQLLGHEYVHRRRSKKRECRNVIGVRL